MKINSYVKVLLLIKLMQFAHSNTDWSITPVTLQVLVLLSSFLCLCAFVWCLSSWIWVFPRSKRPFCPTLCGAIQPIFREMSCTFESEEPYGNHQFHQFWDNYNLQVVPNFRTSIFRMSQQGQPPTNADVFMWAWQHWIGRRWEMRVCERER